MMQIWRTLKQHPELLIAGLMLALMMNGVIVWMRATEPGFMVRVLTIVAIGGISAAVVYIILYEIRRVNEEEFSKNVFKNKPEEIEDE
jgi:hypothetical protein